MYNRNCMHNEIKLRLKAGIMSVILLCYIYVKVKIIVQESQRNIYYTTYPRPAVSDACCTWATTAGDENRLNIFERKERIWSRV